MGDKPLLRKEINTMKKMDKKEFTKKHFAKFCKLMNEEVAKAEKTINKTTKKTKKQSA